MRKKATPEELEAFTLKQLSENPNLTREQIESWDKIGSPMTAEEYQEHRLRRNREREQANISSKKYSL